jgi:hypothetical protein
MTAQWYALHSKPMKEAFLGMHKIESNLIAAIGSM